MPQQLNIQDILYSIEAVLLGAIIAYGYFRSRMLRKAGPAGPASSFENSIAFELPYAVNQEIFAAPSTEIVAGLFIYFNEASAARIAYQQLALPHEAGKTSRYCLRIIQHDVSEVEWLALERRNFVEPDDQLASFSWTICSSANQTTKIRPVLIANDQTGAQERIEFPEQDVYTEFHELRLIENFDAGVLGAGRNLAAVRFVILIEVKAGLCIDVRAWDIEHQDAKISRRGK